MMYFLKRNAVFAGLVLLLLTPQWTMARQDPCAALEARFQQVIDQLSAMNVESDEIALAIQINIGQDEIVIDTFSDYVDLGESISRLRQRLQNLRQRMDALYQEGLDLIQLMIQAECPIDLSAYTLKLYNARFG